LSPSTQIKIKPKEKKTEKGFTKKGIKIFIQEKKE